MAEQSVRFQQVDRLEGLLSDLRSYMNEAENSPLLDLYEYYAARLIELQRNLSGAQRVYSQIGNDFQKDIKLRAYTLCDFASLLVRILI